MKSLYTIIPNRLFAGIIVLAVFGVLHLEASAQDQHHAIKLNKELALPSNLHVHATLVAETETGHFKILRKGDNAYFCITDAAGDDRFSVECHPKTLWAFLERKEVLSKEVEKAERDEVLIGEIKSGELPLPVGSLSRFISGSIKEGADVPERVRVWSEIAVPFATSAQTGITLEDAGTEPWLMGEGTYGAHIMIGYQQINWDKVLHHFD